ncbi:23820_t:CDS:10 [Entrophospora sp. SA101]|nr:11911_t:CDS:10 [Entrophospora sp. SA101]CAJ0759436.1 23820_t:CDS:10 [Entrophospora sp. SA101]
MGKKLNQKGINFTVRHEFFDYVNGISLTLPGGLDSLKKNLNLTPAPGYVDDDELEKRDYITNDTIQFAPNNNINEIHKVTGVDRVQNEFLSFGTGIKVGIVDSGIDYRHPALGGCFGTGCRVAYGHNFVLDLTNLNASDPLDICNGHGTHVAGLIGANDSLVTGFMGVAPNVTFGVYRALNCVGSGSADNIMAALEAAATDQMDIINLSLGGEGWAETSMSVLADSIANRGINVIAANGNEGIRGIWDSGIPAIGYGTISVASMDAKNFLVYRATDIKDSSFIIDYISSSARPFNINQGETVIFDSSNNCKDVPAQTLAGKVVILNIYAAKINQCIISQLYTDLQIAKVVGALVINNLTTGPALASPRQDDVKYPVAYIISTEAQLLLDRAVTNKPLTLDFSDKKGYIIENSFGSVISYFSSWGLTPTLDIKEIVAPGGVMFSTYPLPLGSYSLNSGTSMATPYIAGCVALYLSATGIKQPTLDVRNAFMNYARPLKFPSGTVVSPVLQQGTGLVNVFDTILGKILISPSKLTLNDTLNGISNKELNYIEKNLTVKGLSEYQEVSFIVIHEPSYSLNGYNGTTILESKDLIYSNVVADIIIEPNIFTITNQTNLNINLKITPPTIQDAGFWFYNGFIKFVPNITNYSNITIPYAGLASPAKDLPIFQSPEFPQILTPQDATLTPNHTFSMTFENHPVLRTVFSTPSALCYVIIFSSITNQPLGILTNNDNTFIISGENRFVAKTRKIPLFRNWAGDYIEGSFSDNGEFVPSTTVSNGKQLPNGDYYIQFRALKLFGDTNVGGDWEYWNSTYFKIERTLF